MDINSDVYSGKSSINIIPEQDDNIDTDKCYELQMIKSNNISVFLGCISRNEDGIDRYEYNTTSMISIRELSEKNSLRYDELCILIDTLAECRKKIDEYLLSPEGVILDPEYIFYDRSKRKIRFCFYPWNPSDIFSSYTVLTEFILSAVDYDDEAAVKLAYEVYASVLNKDYELSKYIDHRISDENSTQNDMSEMTDSKDLYDMQNSYYTQNMCSVQNTTDSRSQNKERTLYHAKNTNNEFCDSDSYSRNCVRFSYFSVVCVTLLLVGLVISTVIYLTDKRQIELFLSNARLVSISIFAISLFLYFPIMNIFDIRRSKYHNS